MLPKKNKLPSFLIPKVVKKGKYYSSLFFKLVKIKQHSLESKQNSKFAIIIPRKITKKASEKNKLKKRIKNFLMTNLNIIKNGYNVIIMVNKNVITKKPSLINDEIVNIFRKAKLLK